MKASLEDLERYLNRHMIISKEKGPRSQGELPTWLTIQLLRQEIERVKAKGNT